MSQWYEAPDQDCHRSLVVTSQRIELFRTFMSHNECRIRGWYLLRNFKAKLFRFLTRKSNTDDFDSFLVERADTSDSVIVRMSNDAKTTSWLNRFFAESSSSTVSESSHECQSIPIQPKSGWSIHWTADWHYSTICTWCAPRQNLQPSIILQVNELARNGRAIGTTRAQYISSALSF